MLVQNKFWHRKKKNWRGRKSSAKHSHYRGKFVCTRAIVHKLLFVLLFCTFFQFCTSQFVQLSFIPIDYISYIKLLTDGYHSLFICCSLFFQQHASTAGSITLVRSKLFVWVYHQQFLVADFILSFVRYFFFVHHFWFFFCLISLFKYNSYFFSFILFEHKKTEPL